MIRKIQDKLFLTQVPVIDIIWFRSIYCLSLIIQLLLDFEPKLYQITNHHTFNPIPLFETFHITRATPTTFVLFYGLLIIFLSLTIVGKMARISHIICPILAFIVFGNTLSLTKAAGTNYVYHSQNIVIFYLFLFIFLPKEALKPLWKSQSVTSLKVNNWPKTLALFSLSVPYFGATYCRLAEGGLQWFNGTTLQYYLLEHALMLDRPATLWIAQHHWASLTATLLFTLFETTFIFAIFFHRLRILYAIGGILMHLTISYLMGINFFKYHLLSYFVFVEWQWLISSYNTFKRRIFISNVRSQQ